jgi:hypothetical protein
LKTESVTVSAANLVGGVAELLDAIEPADVDAIEFAGVKLGAFAAMLRGAKLLPLAPVRAKTPEPEREPMGNAQPPAEQAPPPGEWSEPPGLLLKVLASVDRAPSAAWALARRLDLNKRDVDALVLRNLHLFEPVRDMRAALELSEAGRVKLTELRSRSAPEANGAVTTPAAA